MANAEVRNAHFPLKNMEEMPLLPLGSPNCHALLHPSQPHPGFTFFAFFPTGSSSSVTSFGAKRSDTICSSSLTVVSELWYCDDDLLVRSLPLMSAFTFPKMETLLLPLTLDVTGR
jgi:hypothetical protein